MWKLSQVLLYAILIVLMPSGAYARGGPLHLFVPTTKPNTETIFILVGPFSSAFLAPRCERLEVALHHACAGSGGTGLEMLT